MFTLIPVQNFTILSCRGEPIERRQRKKMVQMKRSPLATCISGLLLRLIVVRMFLDSSLLANAFSVQLLVEGTASSYKPMEQTGVRTCEALKVQVCKMLFQSDKSSFSFIDLLTLRLKSCSFSFNPTKKSFFRISLCLISNPPSIPHRNLFPCLITLSSHGNFLFPEQNLILLSTSKSPLCIQTPKESEQDFYSFLSNLCIQQRFKEQSVKRRKPVSNLDFLYLSLKVMSKVGFHLPFASNKILAPWPSKCLYWNPIGLLDEQTFSLIQKPFSG